MRDTLVHEHLRFDTGHLAAMLKHSVGDDCHQPLVGTAIHQTVPVLGNPYGQLRHGLLVYGVVAFVSS